MEKRSGKKVKKIVITGAESTGKTTLTQDLAKYYKAPYVYEYAREYVEKLNRKYVYNDIEYIAQKQLQLVRETEKKTDSFLFIDTYLIIIKIWFEEVFNKYPEWLDKELLKNKIELFLVCDTDIPWIPDPVRENKGERRIILQRKYIEQLEKYKFSYKIVHGKGEERLIMAAKTINSYFNMKETITYGKKKI